MKRFQFLSRSAALAVGESSLEEFGNYDIVVFRSPHPWALAHGSSDDTILGSRLSLHWVWKHINPELILRYVNKGKDLLLKEEILSTSFLKLFSHIAIASPLQCLLSLPKWLPQEQLLEPQHALCEVQFELLFALKMPNRSASHQRTNKQSQQVDPQVSWEESQEEPSSFSFVPSPSPNPLHHLTPYFRQAIPTIISPARKPSSTLHRPPKPNSPSSPKRSKIPLPNPTRLWNGYVRQLHHMLHSFPAPNLTSMPHLKI